jgi:hypothetical protein
MPEKDVRLLRLDLILPAILLFAHLLYGYCRVKMESTHAASRSSFAQGVFYCGLTGDIALLQSASGGGREGKEVFKWVTHQCQRASGPKVRLDRAVLSIPCGDNQGRVCDQAKRTHAVDPAFVKSSSCAQS